MNGQYIQRDSYLDAHRNPGIDRKTSSRKGYEEVKGNDSSLIGMVVELKIASTNIDCPPFARIDRVKQISDVDIIVHLLNTLTPLGIPSKLLTSWNSGHLNYGPVRLF